MDYSFKFFVYWRDIRYITLQDVTSLSSKAQQCPIANCKAAKAVNISPAVYDTY
jgi:hypothetical protein